MIKKIKGSLFAKIFAITFLLTSICCVLTYTVISWLVPKTYSTTLDASLENTVSSFIAELQTMSPLESGTLFDEFLLNNNGVLLQLSDDDGNAIELPSQGAKEFPRFLDGGIATENTDPAAYRATHSYLFSFAGSDTVYTLTVAGSAHEVDLLRNTLANVFIILFFVILIIATLASMLYSRYVTRPVLRLSAVCRQQMRWLKQGLIPVPISVNMSRMCLYDPHIVDEYIGVLNGSGLSAAYIKLELTESAFFENISIMNNIIEALHKVGIKVLMDDFGTGYSSMMMLKNVAIDVLKLDKSFVDDIGDDRSEKIISNIIYLAHSLQIEVTAEGVETAAQFEFLKSVGCDYIQGYYFGKPQPAEDFAALLQKEFYDGSDAGADKKG